jgi:E3 ubiquitin-protein ligase DOA10
LSGYDELNSCCVAMVLVKVFTLKTYGFTIFTLQTYGMDSWKGFYFTSIWFGFLERFLLYKHMVWILGKVLTLQTYGMDFWKGFCKNLVK